jgi:hypothetical protein
MFGTNTEVLSISLFKIITKLALRDGSQIINNAQEQNFAKAIDDLGKFGEDLFACQSTGRSYTESVHSVAVSHVQAVNYWMG